MAEEEYVDKNLEDIMKERAEGGQYFDPPKGECVIEYEMPARIKTRISKYGKEQAQIFVKSCKTFRGSIDYHPEKEWWITITSPVFQALYDLKTEGKARISRAGDGQSKTIEVLDK